MTVKSKRCRRFICIVCYVSVTIITYNFIQCSKKLAESQTNNETGHKKVISSTPSFLNLIRSFKRWATEPHLSEEITLVTAYWNLGRFKKGSASLFFDTNLYYKWTNVFRYIMNPLVVYTDSLEYSNIMQSQRNSTIHRTRIYLVDRNSSWAFRNVERIGKVYSNKGYPKHHPNTVLPEYACAQHAKYDVVVRAARENVYRTKYFAWLDVGYFRDRNSKKPFRLIKPNNFNESLVAMNEVSLRNKILSTDRIFKENVFWVGGGLALGRHDIIIRFGGQFQRAVDYFLSKGLMNTDQQIIYGMYTDEGKENIDVDVKLQTYTAIDDWFFLGNQMVEEINTR